MGLIVAILTILFWFFLSFTACHYFLATFWKNPTAVLITSTVYAILFAILVKLVLG